ncbi:hypothetical protein [Actinomycetospora lemnae]|uniref:Uncharacterized protein n=1 Tax=Actinomycetospora lemnae TaxID=3019891 RepID=A0ABT5T2T0_9PSEU|nr:hypothetical protein [Actinomycetospora sp. DW7H6]MDD7969304.1 hypothetical protein [Actinomycetospora sp. DW7H6]
MREQAGDQQRLQALLTRFEQAQTGAGGDVEVRAAVLAIAQAGASPDSPVHAPSSQRFVREMMDCGGSWDDSRPWRWIAAVTDGAARSSNLMLVAHAALFTFFYSSVMAPTFGQGDFHDMRMWAAPDQAAAAVYTAALATLPRLNPDTYVVHHDDTNAMQVRDVLGGCALAAQKLTSYLNQPTLAVVNQVLGRR